MLRLRSFHWYAVLVVLAAIAGQIAHAQEGFPYVPPERLDRTRPLNASSLRVCVWQNSPLRYFEELVAEGIAHALLLEPELRIIGRQPPTNDSDFWEAIYLALHNECDALMGHILVISQLPDWLTASRPYYETPSVLAVTSGYAELNDVPVNSLVGSQLATSVDYQFLRYLQSSENRWRRLPYDSVTKMVNDLREGVIEAAVVQEAVLYATLDFEPETQGVSIASIRPLPAAATEFVIAYLSSESSLRTILDQAIGVLREDGSIKEFAYEAGLPAGL